MTFSAIIDADRFRRAYLCASTEATRYYLNGVFVTSSPEGGALLVAADGAKMVVMRDATAKVEGSAIVALTPATRKALIGKRGQDRKLVVHDQRAGVAPFPVDDAAAWIASPDHAAAYQPGGSLVDGTFPEWRHFVPRPLKGDAVGARFDADALALVAKALSVSKVPYFAAYGDGASDPHLVLGSDPDAFGVLMPRRVPEAVGGVPSLPLRVGE